MFNKKHYNFVKSNNTYILKLWITVFIIFAIMLLISLKARLGLLDDSYFKVNFANYHGGILSWTKYRYNSWSSRNIIELCTLFMVHHWWLWRVINAILMTVSCVVPVFILRYYGIGQQGNLQSLMLVSTALFLLIPKNLFNDTGWIATTTNYLWVAACDIVLAYCVIALVHGGKHPIVILLLALITDMYGANQEQSDLLIVVALSILMGFLVWSKNKRNFCQILPLLLISIVQLIFIKLCPGNKKRYKIEVSKWYPSFPHLSILKKLDIGFSSSMKHLFFAQQWNIVFFTITLLCIVFFYWKSRKKNTVLFPINSYMVSFVVIISLLPLFCYSWSLEINNIINLVSEEKGTNISFTHPLTYTMDIVFGLLFISVLFLLVTVARNKLDIWINVILLFAAVLVRMVLGFSPTVAASGYRTYLFTFFIFNFITLKLLNQGTLPVNYEKLLNSSIISFSLLNFIISWV